MTSQSNTAHAIAENLFTWPSNKPRLLGSRCQQCQRLTFPCQDSCSACCSNDMCTEELPNKGTLWTWTVQRFMPKSPYNSGETMETFQPYGVGYIELPGAVRVEARLTENDPAKLKIGMAMELVVGKFREDDNGDDIISFAFKPVE